MPLHDTSFRKSAVSMKAKKDRRFTKNGLRNILNTQKREKVRWGRVTSADFFCCRHYSSHTFTAKPPLKKYVFVQCPFGGGEGSRTPVRKQIRRTFSGCRRLFTFPSPGVNRHTRGVGRVMMRGTVNSFRTHGRHSFHALYGSWPFRTGRPLSSSGENYVIVVL